LDEPLHYLPPPRGVSARVVVTEYELPRQLLAPHDVHGDSKGNIWYTAHRSPYIGKLDPRTGAVKEYRVPDTPGALPGTHRVWVDKQDIVWLSENWSHNLTRFDPKTEQFKQFHIETDRPVKCGNWIRVLPSPPRLAEVSTWMETRGSAGEAECSSDSIRGLAASRNIIRRFPTSHFTRRCRTKTVKCGRARCMRAAFCDSIRGLSDGSNTRCPNPIRTIEEHGSIIRQIRLASGTLTTTDTSCASSLWNER